MALFHRKPGNFCIRNMAVDQSTESTGSQNPLALTVKLPKLKWIQRETILRVGKLCNIPNIMYIYMKIRSKLGIKAYSSGLWSKYEQKFLFYIRLFMDPVERFRFAIRSIRFVMNFKHEKKYNGRRR